MARNRARRARTLRPCIQPRTIQVGSKTVSLAVHQTVAIQHIDGVKALRVRPARFGADPAQTIFAKSFGRELDDSVEHHVRLLGVDGVAGAHAQSMAGYIGKREVTCRPAEQARYRCMVDGKDLSEVVLFNGGAGPPRRRPN